MNAGDLHLIAAPLLGIVCVVLLISLLRVHPFLSLIFGSAVIGVVAGMPTAKIVDSFTAGVGSTVGSVGLLIALGSMIGALLADSGGADVVVDRVVGRSPRPMAALGRCRSRRADRAAAVFRSGRGPPRPDHRARSRAGPRWRQ